MDKFYVLHDIVYYMALLYDVISEQWFVPAIRVTNPVRATITRSRGNYSQILKNIPILFIRIVNLESKKNLLRYLSEKASTI